MVQNFDLILCVAFDATEREKERWEVNKVGEKYICYEDYKLLFTRYDKSMHLLRQMTVFTEEDTQNLQDSFDELHVIFKYMFDRSKVTGYFHLGFSGHLRQQIEKFGSLGCLSQESWEALMGEIKRFLLR